MPSTQSQWNVSGSSRSHASSTLPSAYRQTCCALDNFFFFSFYVSKPPPSTLNDSYGSFLFLSLIRCRQKTNKIITNWNAMKLQDNRLKTGNHLACRIVRVLVVVWDVWDTADNETELKLSWTESHESDNLTMLLSQDNKPNNDQLHWLTRSLWQQSSIKSSTMRACHSSANPRRALKSEPASFLLSALIFPLPFYICSGNWIKLNWHTLSDCIEASDGARARAGAWSGQFFSTPAPSLRWNFVGDQSETSRIDNRRRQKTSLTF